MATAEEQRKIAERMRASIKSGKLKETPEIRSYIDDRLGPELDSKAPAGSKQAALEKGSTPTATSSTSTGPTSPKSRMEGLIDVSGRKVTSNRGGGASAGGTAGAKGKGSAAVPVSTDVFGVDPATWAAMPQWQKDQTQRNFEYNAKNKATRQQSLDYFKAVQGNQRAQLDEQQWQKTFAKAPEAKKARMLQQRIQQNLNGAEPSEEVAAILSDLQTVIQANLSPLQLARQARDARNAEANAAMTQYQETGTWAEGWDQSRYNQQLYPEHPMARAARLEAERRAQSNQLRTSSRGSRTSGGSTRSGGTRSALRGSAATQAVTGSYNTGGSYPIYAGGYKPTQTTRRAQSNAVRSAGNVHDTSGSNVMQRNLRPVKQQTRKNFGPVR